MIVIVTVVLVNIFKASLLLSSHNKLMNLELWLQIWLHSPMFHLPDYTLRTKYRQKNDTFALLSDKVKNWWMMAPTVLGN